MPPEQQLFFMARALSLAMRGRHTAPPNPWVGCVLVKEGKIVGEGYHQKPGLAHAEAMALQAAGQQARGATAFVTLEPCSHTGRTPACAHHLVEAGVAKVVIPFLDPDPQVSGRGVAILENAGIEVEVGVGEQICRKALAPYIHHRKTGLPYVHLKVAASLDGRIAAEDGSSQWITNESAREDVHQLRAYAQAILVGRTTVENDRPSLTVRHPLLQAKPLRVVLDTHGILESTGPLFDSALGETLLFSSKAVTKEGAEVVKTPLKEGCLDLLFVLKELGKRGVLELLVEGGSKVWTAFIKERLAQKLTLYQGDKLLGLGPTWLGAIGVTSIEGSLQLQLQESAEFEGNLKATYLFDT